MHQLAASSGGGAVFAIVFLLILLLGIVSFFAIIAFAIRAFLRSARQARLNRNSPILQRPATVIAKRTGTIGGGNSATRSNYYVTFEFPDRSRQEFPLSGNEFGLVAEGDQGTLVSQGTVFQNFQRGGLIQDRPAF